MRRFGNGYGRTYSTKFRIIRWFNWFNADPGDQHTIVECKPNTLTLCFMGPKTREWGYRTPEGWVHWKTYSHNKYRNEKLDELTRLTEELGGYDEERQTQ